MHFYTIMQKIVSFFLPLVYLIAGTSVAKLDYSDKLGNPDYIGLKDVYADYFRIGTAVSEGTVADPALAAQLVKNFNSVTLENAIKQIDFNPREGVFNLEPVRKVVDFAEEHGIAVRGHTLLWLPIDNIWMYYDENGGLVTKDVLFERLEAYVETVMTEFSYIDEWDILNEAFHYNNSPDFKPSPFMDIAGEEGLVEYLRMCEDHADERDKFYINETKILNNTAKERHTLKYVEKWLDMGIKIDGIGLQGHWIVGTINENPLRLQQVLDKIRKLDLEVQITEMDYSIYTSLDQPGYDPVPRYITTWQTFLYQQMFKVFRDNSDMITSVTFWGINDAHSYPNHDVERLDYASLFDRNGMPKENFFAVCDF